MSFPTETGRLPTLEALEHELLARVDTRPAPRYPRATLATAATALVVAVTTLTPFGRALADRVGELIGIGDPPTREQTNPVGEPAVVVGVGEYDGQRFEIVASADPPFGAGVPCFSLDFPELSGTIIGGCMTDAAIATVGRDGIAADAIVNTAAPLADTPILVVGLVDPAATRVSVGSAVPSTTAEASIGRLTPELGREIGVDRDLSYFVAFLPRAAAGTELSAAAFGRDGSELAKARFPVAPVIPPPPGP